MKKCYRFIREPNTNAIIMQQDFLQMVTDQGGVGAAKQLLHSEGFSEGLTALWECKRLDISMESLVLQAQWAPLFTEEELNIAREKLNDLGYNPGEGL